jgi:uncharacterized membrane protein YbaN (DUF454 family)
MINWTFGSLLRRILRFASGVGLVILGIIGLILPIMPGWIFLIPGLVILADFFPPLKRVLEWAKRKAIETRNARWPR